MAFRVKYKGREVCNPLARVLITIFALCYAAVAIAFGVALVLLSLVVLPITLPLHLLLRLFGRRGFFYVKPGGTFTYAIGPGAFGRA